MQLLEVNDNPQYKKEFIQFPVRLYKNEKLWIRPMDHEIEEVFDPKKNKSFRQGECIRWILQNNAGETIGRVAAFFNKKTARSYEQPTGGLGFFDCIDDEAAAFQLFDACKAWLQERGMEAMDGPINFGDRDRWWGVLIDGFDKEPNYGMFYHFPYYQRLFEAYGFQIYYKQFTYARKVLDPLSEQVNAKAERVARDPNYTFRHIEKKKLDAYAEEFRTIYNKAWTRHQGVAAMSSAQAKGLMQKMKPILDEDIIWFSYYKGEPVGFFIILPELNQIFKHLNGKLDWWGKLQFVYHKWRGTCKKMFGVVFGIVPEHQGKGLEGAMVVATGKHVQHEGFRYQDFEMNWIGDFNPKMVHVAEQMGGRLAKVHATYRKLFDETKPFTRAKVIE
ncbi:hypothetical protein SAMN05421823_103624 [Catalinimonas alkaloidigena]|uniref:N-acetyltransferase domain-containing protein n=1 Tax=Catalinimonas alkaloidigena TaxID=1075417 RepID=A0A1G9EZ61_9BACT|nr:hypothetical protein [Catalinimonas alkaloidigena]SDK81285.1 hypothetical protein SAMN05421823_103624 [Catalinimonas alkaloidigena]